MRLMLATKPFPIAWKSQYTVVSGRECRSDVPLRSPDRDVRITSAIDREDLW
ncbi:hypothetical protein [Chamaesiphon sp. OTE_75_metabat_556]|uniref:hypothetical protein n=1 Tax=Chamaesiphon sp. OTE_75_metabat_556 TaxID=2964692 RepID=UPI00286CC594|nr:hypothetical protein [Chamaesiphon sp. OTE_75_metabat_556]